MRRIDLMVLCCAAFFVVAWVIFSGLNGFKASGATIVTRSVFVSSTIDGQVTNNPPRAGDKVQAGSVLVSILDSRIDKSKLTEYESQVPFLTAEINNIANRQTQLRDELARAKQRAAAFSAWLLKEIEIKQAEAASNLEIARSTYVLKTDQVARIKQLQEKGLTTDIGVQTAKTEAVIAENELRISEAQMRRNQILSETLAKDEVFFESGDASYWDKMVDELSVRIVDNESMISTLSLQLEQVKRQAAVERSRVASSYVEEHRAPFDGVINTAMVTRDTRVTTGTNLYQILDCAKPIIIVPIPDNRLSEFEAGLSVTVYPTDTDEALEGRISYVTSGALIGADASIQIHDYLIMQGNRAIVELVSQPPRAEHSRSCEAQRTAIAVIHTKSWLRRLFERDEESIVAGVAAAVSDPDRARGV